MVATQAQRAALYTKLADAVGEDAADTLMNQLPPAGWDQMATKSDLSELEARLTATIAESSAKMTEGFAHASAERARLIAELDTKMTEGCAHASAERARLIAELDTKMTEGFAHATTERAELMKSQARQLYIIVTTTVAATISIWFAVLNLAG